MPSGLPINLIVAVSFGLFVPPRMLEGTRYGGLNVHPSMLPEYGIIAHIHRFLTSSLMHAASTVLPRYITLFYREAKDLE